MKRSRFGLFLITFLTFSCSSEDGKEVKNELAEKGTTSEVKTLDKIYLEKNIEENPNFRIADSLSVTPIKISSELVFEALKQKRPLQKLTGNVYAFKDTADYPGEIQIAYKRSEGNYYSAFRLSSFGNSGIQIDTAHLIDLDGQGKRELLLKWKTGMMGQAGGCEDGGIIILDIREEPKLIFNVHNYCAEEILSSLDGSYPPSFTPFERKVSINNQRIVISNLNNLVADTLPCCNFITRIPAGTYIYLNGRIQKK